MLHTVVLMRMSADLVQNLEMGTFIKLPVRSKHQVNNNYCLISESNAP